MSLRSFTSRLFGVASPVPVAVDLGRVVDIGTDVAAFLLFHPADLQHRQGDPIAWYSHGFAYRAESAAGRLMGFAVGGDGGYRIRLTTGPLSAAETAAAIAGWAFPMTVRHGALYLDNGDGLPGEEQMEEPADFPDRWFPLPKGDYRVDVHPLTVDEGDDALPDYVVAFSPADEAPVAVAACLPDLRTAPGWTPAPCPPAETGYGLWPCDGGLPDDAPLADLGRFTGDPLPGHAIRASLSLAEAEPYDRLLGQYLVVPVGDGGLGVLAWLNALSHPSDEKAVLGFAVQAAIRVDSVDRAGTVRFTLHSKPDMHADASDCAALREAVSRALDQGRIAASPFERERFAALDDPEAMSSWAIVHAPLAGADKLALHVLGARDRILALTTALA